MKKVKTQASLRRKFLKDAYYELEKTSKGDAKLTLKQRLNKMFSLKNCIFFRKNNKIEICRKNEKNNF